MNDSLSLITHTCVKTAGRTTLKCTARVTLLILVPLKKTFFSEIMIFFLTRRAEHHTYLSFGVAIEAILH